MAYRPDVFLRQLPAVRRRIRGLIEQADYLSFAIGGLFGDWGSVACLEAYRMGRPYAVWTDRVESEVTRRMIGQGSWRQSLRARLYHRPMAMLERHVIRRARVGFFHGHETYTAYSPFCGNPQTVHDIHISKTDHIGSGQLEAKVSDVAGRARPLRIVYVGRADPMKGPFDWLATLEALQQAGIDFEAKWIGDGSEYAAMQGRIDSSGLRGRVSLPGFASDRKEVLESLRQADIFLFCHKTPESPRCLIEALTSGTPIVGYGGAFASDLIKENGGGVLVERDNVAALSREVIGLSGDPGRLAKLIAKAAADGFPFDDVSVFRHRAELIREHLPLR